MLVYVLVCFRLSYAVKTYDTKWYALTPEFAKLLPLDQTSGFRHLQLAIEVYNIHTVAFRAESESAVRMDQLPHPGGTKKRPTRVSLFHLKISSCILVVMTRHHDEVRL